MPYLDICFLCIGVLAVLSALRLMGKIPFEIPFLPPILAIVGLVCFYFAVSHGEVHELSQRIAKVIVKIVQIII